MTVDDEALTRIHIDALTGFHINNLKCAQAFYFYHSVVLQPILHHGYDRGDKTLSCSAVYAMLFCQRCRKFAQI